MPGGFVILPDARVDDGELDVLILAPSGLAGWVQVGLRVAVGLTAGCFHGVPSIGSRK